MERNLSSLPQVDRIFKIFICDIFAEKKSIYAATDLKIPTNGSTRLNLKKPEGLIHESKQIDVADASVGMYQQFL